MRGLRNGGNYRHQLTCDVMKATLKRMKESHEFEKKMPNGGWEKKKQIVVEKMMMSHSNLEYVLE